MLLSWVHEKVPYVPFVVNGTCGTDFGAKFVYGNEETYDFLKVRR